jgi:multicomponent Na+:H+ antiporter subunit E
MALIRVVPFLLRAAALAVLWWVLAEGDARGWYVGAVAVPVTAALSLRFASPRRRSLRLSGVARFIVFFVRASVLGGVDVAHRALARRMPIDPGYAVVKIDPERRGQLLLVGVVCLLPGTVSARSTAHQLTLHALDRGSALQATVDSAAVAVDGAFLPTTRLSRRWRQRRERGVPRGRMTRRRRRRRRPPGAFRG